VRTTEELRSAAIAAAREARALFAADPGLASNAPEVVASLFAAEIGDLAKVLDALEDALRRMRALAEARGGARASSIERAMALLDPVRDAIASALGRERPDPTAPFPLTSSRIKTTPPTEARRALSVDIGLEGESTFFTARTGELAEGGVFVATDEPLPVGTELALSIGLPEGHRVQTGGVVGWVRAPRYRPDELPAGMGVRFLRLAPRDAEAIGRFLARRPAFRHGD
jgi:uncharacterized protein (TIGR02266 family)